MDAKNLLLAALLIIAIAYLTFWTRRSGAGARHWDDRARHRPTPLMIGIGFVTNFLDTLGIGSYATTTSMYKAWNIVRDEKIPGTLNVGHAPPTFVQALIYITIVEVEFIDAGDHHRARPCSAPGSAPASWRDSIVARCSLAWASPCSGRPLS